MIVVALVVACVLPSTAGTAVDPPAKCTQKGAKVLLRSPRAVVYREAGKVGDKVACLYSTGRKTRLEDREFLVFAYPRPAIALAGERVAYAVDDESSGTEPTYTTVTVDDLRTGRPLGVGISAGAPSHRAAAVGSLKLNNRGSYAWIACLDAEGRGDNSLCKRGWRSSDARGPYVRVVKREFDGDTAVLDEGPGIDPRSLRRREATISWIHDGERRTATLE